MTLSEKVLRLAADGGPVYTETDLSRFPVEPFNTFSNLVFLSIIIYFAFKVYKEPAKHYFLALSIPVLFLGFIGGTVYHATRSSPVWLYLDWVPIILLCMAASIYFIFRLQKSLLYKIAIIVLVAFISIGVRRLSVPGLSKDTVGYIATALALLLPLVWYMIATGFKNAKYIGASLMSFSFAIFFRMFDRFVETEFFFMGTHWLWHLFGGIAVFFLMSYIFIGTTSENEQPQALEKARGF
ncbi:ceramidase domain-containing protein [Salinimicrobium sp. GXAS 041]|uniref:ceramidase domain-containing protein n=1 Tax=Salinimicrobium sp. GXAS 041 TaxID=3400806 RepID=UPI003C794E66